MSGQVSLPSWPINRDTLSVWKRTHQVQICYGDGSGSDEGRASLEIETWGGIPPEEQLPIEMAAPCLSHLLV